MSGFKSGASSDDPFGSEDESDDEESESGSTGSGAERSSAQSVGGSDTDLQNPDSTEGDSSVGESAGGSSVGGLPWIYRRDSISDDRPKTVQLHLQESTLDRQRETRRTLEGELGESVKKADLREAALLVGMTRVDEVADVLRDWGYDFE
ncbi:hypothetical protein C491_13932 [Natronococcus amylolyticus DSM 10524]|uniref:Uncharacterized protein n=1 Tax=Natronococcus amylolyticus DSM 10524 TaxID=1227497 RepID=L9X2T1_9EURY|nr:hypothetical protein [Natronococcus amylolyticus]ELY56054.1 hypothetical protein C491_13932 [Natronococcus amylolyticus DSM 10524]